MAEPCLCTAHAAADCDGGGRPLRADGCDCACHGGAEATDAVAATEPECTGETARWCPRHGDCTCPPREDWPDEFTFDGDDCPLHGERSTHADAGPAERLALEAMEHESVVAEVLRLRAELANVSARAAEVPGLSAELDRLRWELAVAMGEKTAGAQCLAEFERMAAKSTELLMRKIDTTLALEEAMRVGLEECERLRSIIASVVAEVLRLRGFARSLRSASPDSGASPTLRRGAST